MSLRSIFFLSIAVLAATLNTQIARAGSAQNDCTVSYAGSNPGDFSQELSTLGHYLVDGYNEGDNCNKSISFTSSIADIDYDTITEGIYIGKYDTDAYLTTPFKMYSNTDVTVHAMGLSECLLEFSEIISPITIDLTHIKLKIGNNVEGVKTLCGSDDALKKVTVCTDATTCDTAYNMLNASTVSDGCTDADGDTYYANDGTCTDATKATMATDCDDTNAAVNPGASEGATADSIDNNCDDIVDDICTDADGDTYYAMDGACTDPTKSDKATDCDDTKMAVNPGAVETADGADNDCDSKIDEGTEYGDTDGDCFCNSSTKNFDSACETDSTTGVPTAGSGDGACDTLSTTDLNGDSATDLDCNTTAANVSPAQAGHDVADGTDNDCDGSIDEDATATGGTTDCTTPDADNDGEDAAVCGGTDCDDTSAAVNTNQAEVAGDGIDNNCDGVVDETGSGSENPPPSDSCDSDNDGFDSNSASCDGTDCDDTSASIHPGAPEMEDSVDNNCDGTVDEGFADTDGDGVIDSEDNCPNDANADQADADNNGVGDVCDTTTTCTPPEVLQSDGTCVNPDENPDTGESTAAPSGCSLVSE